MVTEKIFGTLPDGEEIKLYHLENRSGAFAEVITYGAILVRLFMPDKYGVLRDIVLGYDSIDGYLVNECFFGAIIGRSGNRIEGGRFMLEGREVILAQNEGKNNLHSGPDGFEKKVWEARDISQSNNRVTFHRVSPDGENGFPGEFDVTVTYELTEENGVRIVYRGLSDRTTVANLTNHSYFNLDGEGSGKVLDQYLCIHAQEYTPIREDSIPLGRNVPVEGTPMDFRSAKPIGRDIAADFQQLTYDNGFDHNYVTDGFSESGIREIAKAWSDKSGICMEVLTDCPCVQFYAGSYVKQEQGKNGHVYNSMEGFCLETQVEPNAVNVPAFHSPVLRAGERYCSETVYRFSIKK